MCLLLLESVQMDTVMIWLGLVSDEHVFQRIDKQYAALSYLPTSRRTSPFPFSAHILTCHALLEISGALLGLNSEKTN